jgi:hypothetical protein
MNRSPQKPNPTKADPLNDWTAIVEALWQRNISSTELGKIAKVEVALARKYLNQGIVPNFDTASRIKSYLDGTPMLTWASVLQRLRRALAAGTVDKTSIANSCGFTRQTINHWLKPKGAIPAWSNGIKVHLLLALSD